MIRPVTLLNGVLLFSLLLFAHCKKDDPQPTEEERITQLLASGQWVPATGNWVVVDGVSVAELFTDFKITFTETGYTTTGTTPVWPRNDTWKFKSGSTSILIRDSDQLEVAIENLDERNLKLSLTWNQETFIEGGRTVSVKGKHEFTLVK